MKWIKLVYDKYENESLNIIGIFNTDESLNEIKEVKHEHKYNKNMVFNIYAWGLEKTTGIECDIVFDLRIFQTKINTEVDIQRINGFSDIIQNSIINHPKFDDILKNIITNIELEKPKTVAFVCNYGKYWSVGWAEIIKKNIYNKAKVKHFCTNHSLVNR